MLGADGAHIDDAVGISRKKTKHRRDGTGKPVLTKIDHLIDVRWRIGDGEQTATVFRLQHDHPHTDTVEQALFQRVRRNPVGRGLDDKRGCVGGGQPI